VPRRAARLLLTAAVLAGLAATVLPAGAAPVTRAPGKAIEIYSPYQGQSTCNPAPKAGTLALSRLVMAAYPGSGSSGIARDCSIGGRSEHKEGRAWDWAVSYANPRQRAQAADFVHWLFATDVYGNRFAEARRLGVMYVIWNHKIWSAAQANAGWRKYTGADPHTGPMHISLSWAGALKRTSYWTGAVSPILKAPTPVPASPAKPTTPTKVLEPPTTDRPDTGTDTGGRGDSGYDGHGRDRYDGPPLLLEGEKTVDVLASNDGATTGFGVMAGRNYLLTVTGVYAYGDNPMSADAECSRWPSDGYWHRRTQWEGRSATGALDLTINGRQTNWTPLVDDGNDCDTTSHTYTLVIKARRSGPLRLSVNDDKRDDNGGGLHVVVRALESASPTD
jgi:hypothetical protein